MASRMLRRYPWTTTTLAGVSTLVGAAAVTEATTETFSQESLPRTYQEATLENYWKYRPLSASTRILTIATELTPVMGQWFYLQYCQEHADTKDYQALAVQLRTSLTQLGPAFVKAGQQLSIRPDLLPASMLKELQQLCDSVQPVPDAIALQLLCDELGVQNVEQVFDDIKLVASASLGQVYKGKIRSTDETVAIKVQRPDIRRTFSLDLVLLRRLGWMMDQFTSIFTNQPAFHAKLYESFAAGSYAELDYENEAQHQEFFAQALRERNVPVVVPAVFSQYTTERVLVTEWMEGVKLADCPPRQIQKLIPIGVELFLTQLLDIGFFHADPHPGNLLVVERNGKEQLCLLDFGLCVEITADERRALTQALAHLVTRDFDRVVNQDTKDLGFLPPDFDTTELQPLMTKILTTGLLESGSDLKKRSRKLMEISNELNEVFFRYPFSVPPFFALVTKGLGLLEGIALTGDPNFDIFRASAPYARRRALSIFGSSALRRRTV